MFSTFRRSSSSCPQILFSQSLFDSAVGKCLCSWLVRTEEITGEILLICGTVVMSWTCLDSRSDFSMSFDCLSHIVLAESSWGKNQCCLHFWHIHKMIIISSKVKKNLLWLIKIVISWKAAYFWQMLTQCWMLIILSLTQKSEWGESINFVEKSDLLIVRWPQLWKKIYTWTSV